MPRNFADFAFSHGLALKRPPRQLRFGGGVQACLGTWLARLTIEEAVRCVAEMAPVLTMPPTDVGWTHVLGQYPERLPVAVH
jgi:cytochrome P450